MGKVEDMRAMREARYAERHGAAKPVKKEEPVGALCGHQSIGRKRCIRPKDHPEKNHRYG